MEKVPFPVSALLATFFAPLQSQSDFAVYKFLRQARYSSIMLRKQDLKRLGWKLQIP
jgi:hypothetical protein